MEIAKRLLVVLGLCWTTLSPTTGQTKLDEFGRIILTAYVPDNADLPREPRGLLENKLNQISSNYGVGGSSVNPRFVLSAAVEVANKSVVAGPPQMMALDIELILFIGDAVDNKIYNNVNFQLKGVGTNLNKAFIEAFKKLSTRNDELRDFMSEGKNRITSYYAAKCDLIIKEARALARQRKHDEAIYRLSLVPEACEDCYVRSLEAIASIFREKIDLDCSERLARAKAMWAADQSAKGAEKAGTILGDINPTASCQSDVRALFNSITTKLTGDEKARWEFRLRQYEDKIAAEKEVRRIAEEKMSRDDRFRENQAIRDHEMNKIRVNAYREVALEYAKNQPKTTTHYKIYWR